MPNPNIFQTFSNGDPIVPEWGNAVVTKHHNHDGGTQPIDLGDGNPYVVENGPQITSGGIADGTVTTAKLADDAVTGDKIDNDTING